MVQSCFRWRMDEGSRLDPDQDLLDRLDDRENRNVKVIVAVIAGLSLVAGLIGFFSLQLELHAGQETSIDGGALITIAAAAALYLAHRRIR